MYLLTHLVLPGPVPLVLLLSELLPGEAELVTALQERPVYAVTPRAAGEAHHLG